ncbi:MAG: hypothetical protein QM698_02825 [Micropepsaceae bacterium]
MRLPITAVMAALLSLPAMADDTMKFDVAGRSPAGEPYTATVTLEELPHQGVGQGDQFKVTWDFSGSKLEGIAVVASANRKVLAIGYILDGQPGVSVMVEANDAAEGVWASKTSNGMGIEVWTPIKATDATPDGGSTGAEAAITYERAVECAAATSFVVGTLRATPGSDAAKIDAYDKANSAWIMKLGDIGKDKSMDQRIGDIQAKQAIYASDPDGLATATPVADACVATAPPIE